MAPGRFAVSPFKNVQANVAKKEAWFAELPLSTTSPLESSNAAKATDTFAIIRGSSAGSLLFLPHDKPGKYGQKAATWSASSRNITDFDTSSVETLLAAASEDGRISIASLPDASSADDLSSFSVSQKSSLVLGTQKAIEVVQFHPTSSSLLLSVQGPAIQIWDIASGQSQSALQSTGSEKGHWSATWSHDGCLVRTAAKDNTVNLWDLRQSAEKPQTSAPGHQGFNKASRITSVGDLILTTGFSKTRDRECCLWDPRNFVKPLTTTRIDTNTGVLMPLVDHTRRIVYLAGRSDMTMRWVEVTSNTSLTSGSAALPAASVGAALLPSTSSTLDIMQAEIGKMVLVSNDSVIPTTFQIPRRSYLDFHNDLYPPLPVYQTAAQDGSSWLNGDDAFPDMAMPQPGSAWGVSATGSIQKTAVPAAEKQPDEHKSQYVPAAQAQTPRPAASQTPSSSSVQQTMPSSAPTPQAAPKSEPIVGKLAELQVAHPSPSSAPVQETTVSPLEKQAKPDTPLSPPALSSQPTSVPQSAATNDASRNATQKANVPKAASSTHWSRTFLAGKTALKPEYDDVHGVATTMGAAVQLLKSNTQYLFYPLSGPGGRLAVHALSEKGRLPTHPPTLACGSDIVDFALDPFEPRKVYIACSDAKIRIFSVPESLDGDYGEPDAVLSDSSDKLILLECHPTVKNLLLICSEDRGEAVATVWDTSSTSALCKVTVPGQGIFSASWDSVGSRIAFSCKDRKLRILDPRKVSTASISDASLILVGSAHDSVRPSKVVWADERHLITCGFSRTAFREIALHRILDDKTEVLARATLDISPSPLFPHYDQDTNILFAYSKGERTCHAYEVQPEGLKGKQLTKLPQFEHGLLQSAFAFLPKQTIDLVSFTIPRAKVDFFQDDIFPPTLNKLKPSSLSTKQWADGQDAEPELVDLRPEGMPLLSEAPVAAPKAKTQIFAAQLTEEERQKQYFDNLFQQKQAEVDSDEDDERLRRRNAPPEDDDW